MNKPQLSKSEQREEKNRKEAANLFYRTLSVNHPHVTLEDCYKLYDEIIASKKNNAG